jgi:hypothetical protein
VSCSVRWALCPIDAQAHLLAPVMHRIEPDGRQKGVMGELARLLH